MQFVDEQDRVSNATDFRHHRLDPFLELATILGASHHHGQVEYDNSLVGQDLRDFAADHTLRKTFDDRRFSDASFPQQDRIVLGSAAEDLDRPLDLSFSADYRIELTLLGQLGQVATKTVQGRRLALASLAGRYCCFRSRRCDRRARQPRPLRAHVQAG